MFVDLVLHRFGRASFSDGLYRVGQLGRVLQSADVALTDGELREATGGDGAVNGNDQERNSPGGIPLLQDRTSGTPEWSETQFRLPSWRKESGLDRVGPVGWEEETFGHPTGTSGRLVTNLVSTSFSRTP